MLASAPFLLDYPQKQRGPNAFVNPPLDGSMTIPEICDWHLVHNKTQPVFKYPQDGRLVTLTYNDFVPAIHRAGSYIAAKMSSKLPIVPKATPVVSILAKSDSLTYATMIFGTFRAGIRVFPISPRFSASVIAYLMQQAQVTHVLISVEPEIHKLAQSAIEIVRQETSRAINILPMPLFEQLYQEGPFEQLPVVDYDYSHPFLLFHSSNSTANFPKIIPWNSKTCLQTSMVTLYSKADLAGQVFGCPAIELYHAIGILFLLWTVSSGLVLATLPPVSPAITPTSEVVFKAYRDSLITYALANPRFIEGWAEDESKIQFLSGLKGIVYGGKNLGPSAGHCLAKRGVKLCNLYGSTEFGVAAKLIKDDMYRDWQYFQVNPHASVEFVPYGDGSFEVTIVSTPTHDLPRFNSEIRGIKAYATGDLVMPHPTEPNYWQVLGRAEDQIMLSSGEVINPVGLESKICEHNLVASALIFGRARPCLGVLLELKQDQHTVNNSTQDLEAIRRSIWPKIREFNEAVPEFARISRDMIIITNTDKPMVYTQKGSPKRPVMLLGYQEEINALYKAAGVIDPLLASGHYTNPGSAKAH